MEAAPRWRGRSEKVQTLATDVIRYGENRSAALRRLSIVLVCCSWQAATLDAAGASKQPQASTCIQTMKLIFNLSSWMETLLLGGGRGCWTPNAGAATMGSRHGFPRHMIAPGGADSDRANATHGTRLLQRLWATDRLPNGRLGLGLPPAKASRRRRAGCRESGQSCTLSPCRCGGAHLARSALGTRTVSPQ